MAELSQRTRNRLFQFEGSEVRGYWRQFALMMTISALIASVGLFRNSGAIVIAAMLIAPLMSPILGIAASVLTGRARRTLYLLVIVVVTNVGVVALAYGFLFAIGVPREMQIPEQVIARTDPGLGEMMVALAAGIAGAFVQIKRDEVSLVPGVAIGVALVPPLSSAGMLLYFGEPEGAWEALLLYLTNLAAIMLSACVVFWIMGLRPRQSNTGEVAVFGLQFFLTLCAVTLITLHLGAVTFERLREARVEARAYIAVRTWAGQNPVEIQRLNLLRGNDKPTLELWLIIDVPFSVDEKGMSMIEAIPPTLTEKSLRDALLPILGHNAEVFVRVQMRHTGRLDMARGKMRTEEPAPAAKPGAK